MQRTIAVLPGDGIGREVMREAVRVVKYVADKFGHQFKMTEGYAGGAAYEKYGSHLPKETLDLCQESDAILFGSVGGPISEMNEPKWKDCERNSILTLRKQFKFAVNLRPAKVYPGMASISPIRADIVAKGVDMLIVRELLGDAYFGRHEEGVRDGVRFAQDESEYTEDQVRNAAHAGFKSARLRRKKLTSVDKANVLTASRLWRTVVKEVSSEYPDVELEDMLVDNCAMQLIKDPSQFDVIVTSNMFGDILSDASAALPGSLGLCASASLTDSGFGLFEPPGGSAQDIAGKGVANPIAQILSAALLLRYSFGLETEAQAIEEAVERSLQAGYRTSDIYVNLDDTADDTSKPLRWTEKLVGTEGMTDAILTELENLDSKNSPKKGKEKSLAQAKK